jgi:hypothetical protein
MLYWRDGLEVVKHLFANPVFGPCMDLQLYREFEGPDNQRTYGEFMSADLAWEIQVGGVTVDDGDLGSLL